MNVLGIAFIPGYAEKNYNITGSTYSKISSIRVLRLNVLTGSCCALLGAFLKHQAVFNPASIIAGTATAAEIAKVILVSKIFIVTGTAIAATSLVGLLILAVQLQKEKKAQ